MIRDREILIGVLIIIRRIGTADFGKHEAAKPRRVPGTKSRHVHIRTTYWICNWNSDITQRGALMTSLADSIFSLARHHAVFCGPRCTPSHTMPGSLHPIPPGFSDKPFEREHDAQNLRLKSFIPTFWVFDK